MTTEGQPSLFPDQGQELVLGPMDVDAFAKNIADNARPIVYEDRTSEAARDQGWGPVEFPTRPEDSAQRPSEQPTTTPRKKLFEMPGRNRGRVNSYDQPVNRVRLTEEQREVQLRGIAAVKAALRDKNS